MGTDTLMRTGEVAEQLGVSRQHVVDLCDEGKLPCVRVGTHRRIPRDAVESCSLVSRGWRNDGSQKSLALHALLVQKLLSDKDSVISKAKLNLRKSCDQHTRIYRMRWEELLDGPLPTLITSMLDTSDTGMALRSCTPFAGVLDENTLESVARVYRKGSAA